VPRARSPRSSAVLAVILNSRSSSLAIGFRFRRLRYGEYVTRRAFPKLRRRPVERVANLPAQRHGHKPAYAFFSSASFVSMPPSSVASGSL
jgi:hypothetical protein